MSLKTAPIHPLYDPKSLVAIATHFDRLSTIGKSAQVCKLWDRSMQDPSIWEKQFEKEKIPKVAGKNRDYKADFQVLYPMTLSARKIACLGEFVGEVPKISEDDFTRLFQNDPYEPKKKIYETFRLIVEPHFIKRERENLLVENLLSSGDYQEENNSSPQQEILVPYSLKNIKILSSSSIAILKVNSGPVLRSYPEVFKQCSYPATKVNVCFMREEVPKQSRMLHFTLQKELFNKDRFEVPRLSPRALLNVVKILTTGHCPDARETELTFSSTSDTARFKYGESSLTIGGYSQDTGIVIIETISYGYARGSVPCWTPKEVY